MPSEYWRLNIRNDQFTAVEMFLTPAKHSLQKQWSDIFFLSNSLQLDPVKAPL